MILERGETFGSHVIQDFLGTVGRAELYNTYQYQLERQESALVFNMDYEHASEEWEYPKRVMQMLGTARPGLPPLYSANHIVKPHSLQKVLLLGIGRINPEPLKAVNMGPCVGKVVAQAIRSVAGLHDGGAALGGFNLDYWRITDSGMVTLVNFGLMRPCLSAVAQPDFGGLQVEKDIRELAELAMQLMALANVPIQSPVWSVLKNAACQGFGGSCPSAMHLFHVFTRAAGISAARFEPGPAVDPYRLTPEEVDDLVKRFTLYSIAAFPPPV